MALFGTPFISESYGLFSLWLQNFVREEIAMAMTFLQAALTLLLVVFLVPKLGIPGAPLSELMRLSWKPWGAL